MVFGFAVGMGTVGLRVGPLSAAAARAGAVSVPELGPDWAVFDRGSGRPWPDLSLWTRRAWAVALLVASAEDGADPSKDPPLDTAVGPG